jgi:hypothetical protein
VPYASVVGYFSQAYFPFSCASVGAGEASWVGLGGYGGYPLLQSGTFAQQTGSPPCSADAFYEGIPSTFNPNPSAGNYQQIQGFGPAVMPGDEIAAGNEWDYTPGSSSGTWYTGDVDETNSNLLNWYFSWTLPRNTYGPGTGPGGATEEAVDERPTLQVGVASLLEPALNVFQYDSIYAEEYPDGVGPYEFYPNSLNYFDLNMWSNDAKHNNFTHYLDSGAGQPLNTGVGAVGDGFFDYWDTCGPLGN